MGIFFHGKSLLFVKSGFRYKMIHLSILSILNHRTIDKPGRNRKWIFLQEGLQEEKISL